MAQHRSIGLNVSIHPTAEINVDWLEIGSGSIIGPHVLIEGTKVVLGRESWLDRYAYVGGGSAFDPGAGLQAGDFFHMGRQSHINIARGVTVGDEFGCGVETKVFTHGAYPSALDGFPVSFASVSIGHRVWLPNAWVNPGVTIGNDVVVSARSLINRSLPSGCLAGGIPCRVIRENAYPRPLDSDQKKRIIDDILAEAAQIVAAKEIPSQSVTVSANLTINVGSTSIDPIQLTITGAANNQTEIIKNQLRRHGIRFKYTAVDGVYLSWSDANY